MRRLTILLCFLFIIQIGAFADEYSDFMHSLNLSDSQKTKINEIEKKYKYEIAQLRADVILRNMQMAKYGANPKGQNMLDSDFNNLQDKLNKLEKRKEVEIARTLGLIQRFRYRKYCKTH